jgi:hypothetical protein
MNVSPSSSKLASLALAGAFGVCICALYAAAGNPLFAVLIAVSCLAGGAILAYRTRRWLLCSAATLLLLGAVTITYYYVILPDVVFKINAVAFPGNMLVEFREGCPHSIRGILRRRIEYVVSASGYGCSSTDLPEWFRLRMLFYDEDPTVTRVPPPLAGGTFFATGELSCAGSKRPYAHKALAAPGGPRETWYDFVERVNFKCGVEPSNIAVQRTGARDARPGR